jgi:hypothetical protein
VAELVRAIDVSDSQPANLAALIARHDARHVVCKLYLLAEGGPDAQAHTLAQAASAHSVGASVGGYVWGYSSEDAADTVRQAAALYARAGMVGPIYLDIERYTYRDGRVEPPLTADWIRVFVLTLLSLSPGWTPGPGFYTRRQYIRDEFPGGEDAFAEFGRYPLWLADYDGEAALDCALPKGCTNLVGKQYAEHPVDLDVFDPSVCGGTPMPDTLALADVDEQNQFAASNYDTRGEYAVISAAACSGAATAAVATDYGVPWNISAALRAIRATGDDVTPALGLLNRLGPMRGIAGALSAAGIPASVHDWDGFDRQTFKDVLRSGRPIIVQMENYLGRGIGHFLVVDGLLGDGTEGVTVADSNAGSGKRLSYRWESLWAEMAGGHAVWPDNPRPQPEPVEDDVADEQLKAENAALKDALAKVTGERDRLTTYVAVMGDDIGDALQAAVDTLKRDRAEAIGARPAKAAQ